MIDPRRHRQLFLDDGAVESMSGLRRILHQPINSTPVIIPARSRGERAVQSASVPQWNPEIDLWEWWYKGFSTYTDEYLTLYATSADGVCWEEAEVGLYEWNGTRANNVAFASDNTNLCHVIRDDIDPDPQRRYKGLFSDEEHMDRYPGVSADGFRWEISGGPPIPSHDTSTLVRDDIDDALSRVRHAEALCGIRPWIVGHDVAAGIGGRIVRLRRLHAAHVDLAGAADEVAAVNLRLRFVVAPGIEAAHLVGVDHDPLLLRRGIEFHEIGVDAVLRGPDINPAIQPFT